MKKRISSKKKEWLIEQLTAQPNMLKDMIESLRADDEVKPVMGHGCIIRDDNGKTVAMVIQSVRILI